VDTKSGRQAPEQINNSKDLDVEIKKEEATFFGSFFYSTKMAQKKKSGVIEAVSAPSDYSVG
jgi:dynamin 1-like protein